MIPIDQLDPYFLLEARQSRAHFRTNLAIQDFMAHAGPGPKFQFGALDDELGLRKTVEVLEMVLVEVYDDDRANLVGLDAGLGEELGRLDELFSAAYSRAT